MIDALTGSLAPVLPRLKRAREYHFYDLHGRRYVDLWQEGGRFLLGRRPKGISLTLKNALDQGLSGALPSVYEGRALRQLVKLLPGAEGAALFRNADSLYRRAAQWGQTPALWRPFTAQPLPTNGLTALLLPASASPVVAAVWTGNPPADWGSDLVSPADLAAYVQALHHFERWTTEEAPAALAVWADLSALFPASWTKEGPWLQPPRLPDAEWPAVAAHFLAAGFVIPPSPQTVWVLPAVLSPGERKKLQAALREAPWNS